MERTEWELVPLVQQEREELARSLSEELLNLDMLLDADPDALQPCQRERILELHRRINHCVISPCEASGAPALSARPGFVEEAREAFLEFEPNGTLPLEDFLSLVGDERDCSKCPGATDYPGVSGVRCDLDTTPLMAWLTGSGLEDMLDFELVPEEMEILAEEVESRMDHTKVRYTSSVSPHYLRQVVRYLRYWSGLGFGVVPAVADSIN